MPPRAPGRGAFKRHHPARLRRARIRGPTCAGTLLGSGHATSPRPMRSDRVCRFVRDSNVRGCSLTPTSHPVRFERVARVPHTLNEGEGRRGFFHPEDFTFMKQEESYAMIPELAARCESPAGNHSSANGSVLTLEISHPFRLLPSSLCGSQICEKRTHREGACHNRTGRRHHDSNNRDKIVSCPSAKSKPLEHSGQFVDFEGTGTSLVLGEDSACSRTRRFGVLLLGYHAVCSRISLL